MAIFSSHHTRRSTTIGCAENSRTPNAIFLSCSATSPTASRTKTAGSGTPTNLLILDKEKSVALKSMVLAHQPASASGSGLSRSGLLRQSRDRPNMATGPEPSTEFIHTLWAPETTMVSGQGPPRSLARDHHEPLIKTLKIRKIIKTL